MQGLNSFTKGRLLNNDGKVRGIMKLKKLVRELKSFAEDVIPESFHHKMFKAARRQLLDQHEEIGVLVSRNSILNTLVSNRDTRIKDLNAKLTSVQKHLATVQEELAETKEQAFRDKLLEVTIPIAPDNRPEITHKSTFSPDGDEVWITQAHHDGIVKKLKQDIEKHHKRFAARTDLIDSQAERIQDVVNKRLDAEISRDKEIKAREDLQLVINQLREDHKHLIKSLTRLTDERDKLRDERTSKHIELHNLQTNHAALEDRYTEQSEINKSLGIERREALADRRNPFRDDRRFSEENETLNTISQRGRDDINNQLADQSNERKEGLQHLERREGPTDRRSEIRIPRTFEHSSVPDRRSNERREASAERRKGSPERRHVQKYSLHRRMGPADRRCVPRQFNNLDRRKDQCSNCFGEGCESCSS